MADGHAGDISPLPDDAVRALKAAVGEKGWLDKREDLERFNHEERNYYRGESPLVLRPADTAEVAAVVKICAEYGIPICPQGGNTGLVGGAVPGRGHVVISLGRMDKLRAFDPVNATMTVEAGMILVDVQKNADEAGLLFPLSLAAEGTCQIGGNLATNAGGIQVLRYGNARDLVLGLEVVTAEGLIWDGLKGLRKNNTGYDLKHLFMGSEGTLGIITAAVLKLFPKPRETVTCMVAAESPADLSALLGRLKEATGNQVNSFEYICRAAMQAVFDHIDGSQDPFTERYEHHALTELASGQEGTLMELVEATLADAFEAGEIIDAVIAQTGEQAAKLWHIREHIPEALKYTGPSAKHDISVPVSSIPDFLAKANAHAEKVIPGVTIMAFGHMGDGNLHYNLVMPKDMPSAEAERLRHAVPPGVHDIADSFGGSFSAEHGIGLMKVHEMDRYKSDVEKSLLRTLKHALDPMGILNPGKVVP
ncbi:MAG: FAD-binding oxidoreductase [Rhodospirillaceae bacterium]